MQPGGLQGALRILIVEDEPDIREAMAEAMAEAGYQFVTAATLEQARDALARETYDLLLLDVFVDGDTCDELLNELSRAANGPATVLTSADLTRRSSSLAKRFSIPLVLKPFDLDDLVATVGRAHEERLVPLRA
jgi:two-component system response regulator AtoC